MMILQLQFVSKYQVKNVAVHTTWQAIPYKFNVFIRKVEILKASFSGYC